MKEVKKETKIKIGNLLKKYNLLNERIEKINYHMSILNKEALEVIARLSKNGLINLPENISEEDLAVLFVGLIERCDESAPDYNQKLDVEMVRIGLKTEKFPGGHNHNIWNTGTFEDDGFGFGTEPTSLYDDYVDSMGDLESRKIK